MGLFGLPDFLGNGTDFYNVAQGMPGYTQGSTLGGLQQSQAGTQGAIGQQQSFLNALQGNSGLSGAQAGLMGQQQGLSNQYGQLASQQGQLAAQYGQIAAGQGPNPAEAQLAQNTGQNMQQTAALMASARGGQSNPGLIARQAGQAGAAQQQQAVGQAATLGAQQQLAGMQGQQTAYQGQLGTYQGQSGQQNQMANLATAGVGQEQTGLTQLNNQNLANQQMQQQALTAQNQQQTQAQLGQAQLAGQGMQNTAGLVGGGLNALGSIFTMPSLSHGGTVPQHFDVGGAATGAGAGMTFSQTPEQIESANASAQSSPLAQFSQGESASGPGAPQPSGGGASALYQGMSSFGKAVSQGGKGNQSGASGSGGSSMSSLSSLLPLLAAASKGGAVSGKSKVKGDSESNDTVPAMLSPGEIVIPRSHVGSPDKIASFLNGLLGTRLRAA